MTLKVYNTASGELEEFDPIRDDLVKMYVCGTTDYDYIHLGHARTYVAYDMILRYLEWKGYDVRYVQNITDVGHLTDEGEDKIEKKAEEEKTHPMEIVEFFMNKHLNDVDELGIKRPDIMPRATGHIIDMIEAIKELIEKGYAYESNESVYFDINKINDYGKLSNVNIEDLERTQRIGSNEEKKNPEDFALWKKAKPGQKMKWDSPWGVGFPGWHIECSVMSTKYLGERFDIHGGAVELSFPHHENEIAQNKGLTGKEPVKYWVHTGLLNVGGEKMSKSKGNYITVSKALEKHRPEVLRLWILSSHYRSPLNYTEEKIEEAKDNLNRIISFLDRLENLENNDGEKGELSDRVDVLVKEFERAMDKDFNSPKAFAEIYNFIKEANRLLDKDEFSGRDVEYVKKKLKELLNVFNIIPEKRSVGLEEFIPELLDIREELRDKGEYELADEIRNKLKEIGIEIEDREGSPLWYQKLD
ncbi:cysteine--tRNA ligase [archaeon SCG-AAA382B04]|nr:cysteine--tRNA ligase [archaeon SCG-AAA382B04]